MLNHITIMGRLTKEPELRYTQSNIPVASFCLAVDRDIKNSDGTKSTDFINCVAWRTTGEFISKYFGKGSMMVASGRLQVRSYTTNSGENRTASEVVVDSAYFGESKKSDSSAPPATEKPKFEEIDMADGDLPF